MRLALPNGETEVLASGAARHSLHTSRHSDQSIEHMSGTITGMEATLRVKQSTIPKFNPVPFAFREAVEKELQRTKDEDIIEPVRFSELVHTMYVPKADGALYVCAETIVSRSTRQSALISTQSRRWRKRQQSWLECSVSRKST